MPAVPRFATPIGVLGALAALVVVVLVYYRFHAYSSYVCRVSVCVSVKKVPQYLSM